MNIGTRLTESQLIRQIIQGGGNMPAYGNKLLPYEVEALTAYLVSLRPEGQPPARDSSVPAVPPKEQSHTSLPPKPHGES